MPPSDPTNHVPLTLLCLASYEKGDRFLQAAKQHGCKVFLLTSESLRHTDYWPRQSLQDILYLPDRDHEWNLQDMLFTVCHLARTVQLDCVIALDDLDLEKAALLREHLRLPGMGETATRYFRDKLAMRMRASDAGIRVPEFTATFNYGQIGHFLQHVPGPWVLKPRLMAGAIGIQKFHHHQDVWDRIHALADRQSFSVLERFVPGDIFHVDSIWSQGEPIFAIASAYGTPPLEVSHGGGIFTTRILERDSETAIRLRSLNEQVLRAFNLSDGVSHTEFIRAHQDGAFYFLETSARVGGAHISDLIEAATGINLWAEWAKIEIACARHQPYSLDEPKMEFAGLLVSLARQEWPDMSGFQDPEIVWRIDRPYHVGLIVKSTDYHRIGELLTLYTERVRRDFHAALPASETLEH